MLCSHDMDIKCTQDQVSFYSTLKKQSMCVAGSSINNTNKYIKQQGTQNNSIWRHTQVAVNGLQTLKTEIVMAITKWF